MGDVVEMGGAAAPAAEQKKGPNNLAELREAYDELTKGPLTVMMDKFVRMTGPFMEHPSLASAANNAMNKIIEFTGWLDHMCSTLEAMETRAQLRAAAELTEKQKGP